MFVIVKSPLQNIEEDSLRICKPESFVVDWISHIDLVSYIYQSLTAVLVKIWDDIVICVELSSSTVPSGI